MEENLQQKLILLMQISASNAQLIKKCMGNPLSQGFYPKLKCHQLHKI
jgi:hypothetical protein